jgi:predicted dinucleotide-binding enzyme
MNKDKIAIIGSGLIGGTLARLLVKAGYETAMTNSRGQLSLKNFSEELGERFHPVTLNEAFEFGDIIIVSIHWRQIDSIPVIDSHGKIIVDTTNPYNSDGTLFDLGDEISSSKVVDHFPGGLVVKAFNTIWYKHLAENGNISAPLEERQVIPLAGDNEEAKQKISKIIEEIGFGPLDTGTLSEGSKYQGAGGILYGKEANLKEGLSLLKSVNTMHSHSE